MDIIAGNEQLLQVLNACQMPLMWLAITVVALFVAGFIYMHKKNCTKDIHNVEKWSKIASESLIVNLSKNPEDYEATVEKIEKAFQEVANYIGRKEAGESMSIKILERLDELKEMQKK